jgi:hypothetical protein
MNPIALVIRRPITTMMLVGVVVSGGVLASWKMRLDLPRPLNTPKIYVYLDDFGARATQTAWSVIGKVESYFQKHDEEEAHHEVHKVVATRSATSRSVPSTPAISRRSPSKRARP